MHREIICAIFLTIVLPLVLYAQDFAGSYASNETGIAILLNMEQVQSDSVIGTMTFDGIEYVLQGKKQGDHVAGVLTGSGDSLQFTAKIKQQDLILTLSDSAETDTFHFTRLESNEILKQPAKEADSEDGQVIINGNKLSYAQINELESIYGFKPLPGNYWYDSISGLYGVIGFGAYGFMFAGHNFGDLDPNASNGNSNVFVNRRHLPQMEWIVWSQLLGYMIEPGRYWLDANGNAGYEGNLTPMENLYLAAQRNAATQHSGYSSGNTGDNFWSSRFSAGNYDQNNQRGYVSVPGYGPIGYGF